MRQVTLRLDVSILLLLTVASSAYLFGNSYSEYRKGVPFSTPTTTCAVTEPSEEEVVGPASPSPVPTQSTSHEGDVADRGGDRSDDVVVEHTSSSLGNLSGASFDAADDPPLEVIAEALDGRTNLIQLIEAPHQDKHGTNQELEAARELVGSLDTLLTNALNKTKLFADHDSYIILRRLLQNRALKFRRKFVLNEEEGQARAPCFQFVRADQRNIDAISRIPCVPWNSTNLHTVALAKNGVLAHFHHIPPPVRANLPVIRGENPTGASPLRVAVEMSGQMRTYRSCWQSLRKHLLEPNQALLFLASYPDVGDKRFGVRFLERDDAVRIDEVAEMFSPFLASVYVADLPTITNRLRVEFPTLFVQTQFSWMLYQIFMMDLAHSMVLNHHKGASWVDGMDAPYVVNEKGLIPTLARNIQTETEGDTTERPPIEILRVAAKSWKSFDIVIRVRPDLYIMGPVWVRSLSADSAVLNFTCNRDGYIGLPPLAGPEPYVYSKIFSRGELLRTPHHPVHEWVLDPISDHTAVGFTEQVTTFFELYKDAKALSPRLQEREIFFAGNTVERMWTQHTARKGLRVETTFGWHIMLRNPNKFLNSSSIFAKTKRRKDLMLKIFAVSDPTTVGCPSRTGGMTRLPPKPKGKTTVRKYIRRG